MKQYYIAYGSNMHHQWMKDLLKDAVYMGTSFLEQYCLAFRGKDVGYLTLEESKEDKVPVVIWEINTHEHERLLDEYEDYPILYDKVYVSIMFQERLIKGMMYVMKDYPYIKPEQDYYNMVKEAYIAHQFDITYLEKALIKEKNEKK
ncbi:gamma-glutamylcyclotransferase [Carnobacteriaceae bacterium zg-84]|uniref:gamma-glutamylcyclotransferase family protein n=1 Tax=Granulicatella sp. zg-84 TaxID=2678503 RepID=UPI0013C06A63|nr:gamma-glutamylcyclotransferase family protein [Granulicatella sp. zg-84]NEW66609.1 gamma-glutamylcyclotransferase [Granulicatella sp. zg-84]QMI86260.1 gamma-glutamylcyclotransferase [Carnobacteriaceae bacterium zg-84]